MKAEGILSMGGDLSVGFIVGKWLRSFWLEPPQKL